MNNTSTATLGLWFSLVCLVVVAMFAINNRVQSLEKELAGINRGIQEDIRSIHVLKAEWSHLNSPARLRQLASKHIDLNPVKAEQIINYSALPFEYENINSNRKLIAIRNINNQADKNRNLKQFVKAQR